MPRIDATKNAKLEPWKREVLQTAVDAALEAQAGLPGYPPALLPVQVAQFLLESGWGQSGMGSAHNYFGIKARAGEPFVERPTKEWVRGKEVKTVARFRRFESMADCFREHARLITSRKWRQSGKLIYGKALEHPLDPAAFAHALTGIYATDPLYGAKLVSIMRDRGLLTLFTPPGPTGPVLVPTSTA